MKLKKGSIIACNGSMILKVVDMRSTWVKCDYLDWADNTWKPRGVTESKHHLEAMLRCCTAVIIPVDD